MVLRFQGTGILSVKVASRSGVWMCVNCPLNVNIGLCGYCNDLGPDVRELTCNSCMGPRMTGQWWPGAKWQDTVAT